VTTSPLSHAWLSLTERLTFAALKDDVKTKAHSRLYTYDYIMTGVGTNSKEEEKKDTKTNLPKYSITLPPP